MDQYQLCKQRYFEDFEVGELFPIPSRTMTDAMFAAFQLASGLISVTGSEEAPSRTGIFIADISAGMYAYSGVLSAIIQRYKTGSMLLAMAA